MMGQQTLRQIQLIQILQKPSMDCGIRDINIVRSRLSIRKNKIEHLLSNTWHVSNRRSSWCYAASGGLASNYNFTSSTLTINEKVLNSSSSRIYDATTSASASDITLTNQISGETLVLGGAEQHLVQILEHIQLQIYLA